MLHGLCCGEEAGARNLVLFRVKWLQPAMKGTSCVRRLRFGSFRVQSVPPMDFATSGCSCVRSSMRFLTLWWQIADFRNFGASDFPCKNPFKKSFKIVFFSLWRRDPVLELQFPTSLRVVLLCFSTQSL